MKLAFITLFIFNFSLQARVLRYLQTQYYKDDYLLHSRSHYDFNSCQNHSVEEEEFYYVTCENSVLTPQQDLDHFFNDMQAIELEFAEDQFLENLQGHVKRQLTNNTTNMNSLKRCLQNNDQTPECTQAKTNILEMLRRDLPRMRILMAQKSFPGVIYSPTRPHRFRNNIEHSISGVRAKGLTENEIAFLNDHIERQEAAFTQDVLRENEIDGLGDCVEQSDNLLRLKETEQCERFIPMVGYRSDLKFNEQNQIYENQYNDLIEPNPLLTLLTVSGQETDAEIFSDIIDALVTLIDQSAATISNVQSLSGQERVELLGYRQAVDTMLSTSPYEATRLQCDLAQKLLDQNDRAEMMTDLTIALGAVAAGGLCAFTGVGLY